MLRFIIIIASFAISITAIGSNPQSSYSPSNTNHLPAANTGAQSSAPDMRDTSISQNPTRTMDAPSRSQSTSTPSSQRETSINTQKFTGSTSNNQQSQDTPNANATTLSDSDSTTFDCPDATNLTISGGFIIYDNELKTTSDEYSSSDLTGLVWAGTLFNLDYTLNECIYSYSNEQTVNIPTLNTLTITTDPESQISENPIDWNEAYNSTGEAVGWLCMTGSNCTVTITKN